MTFSLVRRAGAAAALLLAAVVLSGCFVTSVNRVDGTGPDADPAMVGTWRGLDDDGKVEKAVFLHVIAHKSGEGLGLVMVDKDSVMLLDGTTVKAGQNAILNATFKEVSGMSAEDRDMLGTHIIKYEITGRKLNLWLLDPHKIADAVTAGSLKGEVEGSGASRGVKLSASSEELNAFFSKPGSAQYFQTKPASLIRFDN